MAQLSPDGLFFILDDGSRVPTQGAPGIVPTQPQVVPDVQLPSSGQPTAPVPVPASTPAMTDEQVQEILSGGAPAQRNKVARQKVAIDKQAEADKARLEAQAPLEGQLQEPDQLEEPQAAGIAQPGDEQRLVDVGKSQAELQVEAQERQQEQDLQARQRRLEQISTGDPEMDDLIEERIRIAEEKAGAEQKAASDAAQVRREMIEFGKQALQEQQEALQTFRESQEQRIQELENRDIDPNRLWNNAGTVGRVGATLAAALGGFLSVKTGSGRNLALEQINAMIERDIAAQRADVNKSIQLLDRRSGLGQLELNHAEKLRIAELNHHADLLKVIETDLTEKIAGLNGQEAIQRGRELQKELSDAHAAKRAELEQATAQQVRNITKSRADKQLQRSLGRGQASGKVVETAAGPARRLGFSAADNRLRKAAFPALEKSQLGKVQIPRSGAKMRVTVRGPDGNLFVTDAIWGGTGPKEAKATRAELIGINNAADALRRMRELAPDGIPRKENAAEYKTLLESLVREKRTLGVREALTDKEKGGFIASFGLNEIENFSWGRLEKEIKNLLGEQGQAADEGLRQLAVKAKTTIESHADMGLGYNIENVDFAFSKAREKREPTDARKSERAKANLPVVVSKAAGKASSDRARQQRLAEAFPGTNVSQLIQDTKTQFATGFADTPIPRDFGAKIPSLVKADPLTGKIPAAQKDLLTAAFGNEFTKAVVALAAREGALRRAKARGDKAEEKRFSGLRSQSLKDIEKLFFKRK